ncbi:MAG: NitT/TauT family transport system permease protein [Limisphaerales bacterium]|jgi:NitT/TauT family transport system permease protein
MIRRPISQAKAILLASLSVAVLLLWYTWVSHRQHQVNPKDTTIPSWGQLADGVKKFTRLDRKKERWIVEDSLATGRRFIYGIGLGVACGFVLGMLMGCFATVEAFLQPPIALLAKVPQTAALAVYFVAFGTGMSMYVAMISLGIIPALAVTVYLAIKDLPSEMLDKAYTLGASNFEVATEVVFRQVLPKFIDAVRLAIGPAIVFLIAAEMVVGDVGFGYRIRLQFKLTNMNVVYPYLVMLAFFGFALDYGLRYLQARLCPWYQRDSK